MCCACQLIILFLLLLVMGHLWCFVFILCNLWADRTGSQSIMFGIVNTERFAALTLRSPVRSLRRHPISTLHSVSSKRCRRSSRHAKPRSERKRFVFTVISCMHNRRGIPRGMKQNNLLPGNMSLRQHVMWGNVSLRQHVIEAMCHVRQRVTWGSLSREATCHWVCHRGNESVWHVSVCYILVYIFQLNCNVFSVPMNCSGFILCVWTQISGKHLFCFTLHF